MRIAICQLNPTVGDLDGNAAKILEAARDAASAGADLIVTPELSLCGYPPRDLLLRRDFVQLCDEKLDELATQLPAEVGVLVGHPTHHDQPERPCGGHRRANAASLLEGGHRTHTIAKSLLPNYDVFDERRYFRAASEVTPIPFRGELLGVHICEDGWWHDPDAPHSTDSPVPGISATRPDPVQLLAGAGATLLVNLSSSPFQLGKPRFRETLMADHAERHRLPLVYVNQHGGNDDLVFDGASFVCDAKGDVVVRCASWQDELRVVDLGSLPSASAAPTESREAQAFEALVCGIRDYAMKSGFSGVVLGLSGGIDSALVAAICGEALGPEHVHGIAMPSRYSSGGSIRDARALADAGGYDLVEIGIDDAHRAFEAMAHLGEKLTGDARALAAQNVQSRIRGSIVMAMSNVHGWLPVTTGNKSELAVGYSTIYGDQNGGFAVIGDLYKTDVYAVSRYVNERAGRELIPRSTIEKPPSAELAPDQRDDDDLPTYDVLDSILRQVIDDERGPDEVDGDPEVVRDVVRRIARAEFKRYQLGPATKLEGRAFGPGWRQALAARWDVGW